MIKHVILAALPLALAGAAGAQTAPPQTTAPQTGKPASIPFIRFGEIYNFEADGDRGVYLETRGHKWYYASVLGPCINLSFANRIAVDTRFGGNQLDSTGVLLVDGDRCQIDTLTESGPPPKKVKKPKH